ncbi:MAG: Ribosomal silencing factor RsfS [Flavobacteriales bacterium]|jgi:ribosome-associated protein|nr:MAG: ribosome silencing factor [Flavobacteriales bacterium]CAI8291503.1 MAG: Ribosomal silencing factor RsfS [Flavobacteriales bacterium]|tara:strand:+ start:1856 stop:2224 length:369 start_codon:yes stop_codon:yes gene_type:complete
MTKKNNTDALLSLIIEGIEEVKGEDINILDLRDIDNNVCKYFVVCSGNSNTQVRAISSSVQKVVSKSLREKPWHVEGQETSEWVLMDFVDVVVHIFQKQTRSHYDIESLWGDAKQTLVESNY